MKLLRFGPPGSEKAGRVDGGGRIRDLSAHVGDLAGAALSPASLARLAGLPDEALPLVAGTPRLGPPVAGIGKLIGIGLNYADHAAEAGREPPLEPLVFLKAPSAVTGPDDWILLPPDSEQTDWEVELAVVIGSPARYLRREDVPNCIAGYCLGLDLSERHWQLERGSQWSKGKSFDSFAPLGPWLVTPDELESLANGSGCAMELAVNGATMQSSRTSQMIFPVFELIRYVSQFMSLQPGDVILTGTPGGVGMGRNPPRYLRHGDRVTASIEGLGWQRHEVHQTNSGETRFL